MKQLLPRPERHRSQGDPLVDHVLKGGWYTLWAMLALTLFGFVDRQVLTLAASPMAISLRLSDEQLGMVQGLAFAIFSVVAVYPIAWAADRIDRRIVLSFCVILWSSGTAACGFAQNFEQLFLSAVAMAAGEAGLVPIASSFIPELFKGSKRLLANGLNYLFACLGITAGFALGGSAIGMLDQIQGDLPGALRSFESWRLAFFLVAIPAPFLLILVAFTRLGRSRHGDSVSTERAGQNEFLGFLLDHRRAMTTVFGGLALYVLAFGGYLVWLPVVATRLFATTPAQNGLAMGIATAIGMISGVAAGTLVVRRWLIRMGPVAPIRFFWLAMLGSTPVIVAFPFVGAAWQLFALFAALMLSGTAIGCMISTVLQDMAPADLRARMFALWGIAYGLVGGSAPAAVGWVSGILGAEPRMLLLAVTLVALPSWLAGTLLLCMAERPFVQLVDVVAETTRRIQLFQQEKTTNPICSLIKSGRA